MGIGQMKISGKVSHFGGPEDTGVTSSEDLAFWEEYEDVPHPEELFLPEQPPGTTGLARRLDPQKYYIACRWDYDVYSKASLASGDHFAWICAQKTGRCASARPADWGPNENTGRVADISPGLMALLGITTDDMVDVTYPSDADEEQPPMPSIKKVAISAGHGEKIAGASGYFEESDETPRVMREVTDELHRRGVVTVEFWDQTSTTQQDNLDRIIDWHNNQDRELDVSIHFNASNGQGHGVEVLYVSQDELAAKVSAAIAAAAHITNRGAKYNGNLAFLNGTDKPAILIEVCFCDNASDATAYDQKFNEVCAAIATAISGIDKPLPIEPIEPPVEPPPVEPPEQLMPVVTVAFTVPRGVDLKITVNSDEVLQ